MSPESSLSVVRSSAATRKPGTPCAAKTPSKGALVGAQPIEQVVLIEDHDKAYHEWRALGLKDRLAVHVDAHLDFDWIPDVTVTDLFHAESREEVDRLISTGTLWYFGYAQTEAFVNIGSYLNPALREGLLKGFYWVVPDAFVATARQRRRLEGFFRFLQKAYPAGLQSPRWIGQSLHVDLLGKPVVVCPLSQLPEFDEPVLLDVDTDFFIIPTITRSYPHATPSPCLPWLWPDQLVAGLRERRMCTDLATIAYSVDGGFTPLEYRYLGDELATCLMTPSLSHQGDIIERKRLLAHHRMAGNTTDAVRICEQALTSHPEDPSLLFVRAQLALDQGNPDKARAHYAACVQLDARYKTRYNQLGPVFQKQGRYRRALAEYRKALTWDPEDMNARRGVAEALYGQRRWRASLSEFKALQALTPDDPQLELTLGKCYVRCRDYERAEVHLRRASESDSCRPLAHYWLGVRSWRTGQSGEALHAFKIARQCGVKSPSLHFRLGLLYLFARRWPEAFAQFVKAYRHFAWRVRLYISAASS